MEKLRSKPYYKPLLWVVMMLGLFILSQQISLFTEMDFIAVDDFVQYWASGRLMAQRGNPYDPDQMTGLQHTAGRTNYVDGTPALMWNPPWTMPLVIPFGLLPYAWGRIVWFLSNLSLVFVSVSVLWSLYGGSRETVWWAWLAGFVCSPVLVALQVGQIGPFILAGCVGFLCFAGTSRWRLAGAFAALLTAKPHLLYLFWAALLLWTLDRRNVRAAFGVAAAILAGTAISLAFNPRLIQDYLFAVQTYPPADWATPTLGGTLRWLMGSDAFWLQFVPAGCGLVWLFVYWRRHKDDWDWRAHMPVLVLVSVVTAAYGWTYDQVVVLVAAIPVVVWLQSDARLQTRIAVLGGYFALSLAHLALVNFARLSEFWFMWLAPGWLIWYVVAQRIRRVGKLTEQTAP